MGINFIPAICPNCGGELRIPDDRKIIKCMYCGYDIVMYEPEASSVKKDVETWFKLAYAVMESNFEEAYHYFTNILEVQPENCEAWFGKALMACELSDINKPRPDEIVNLLSDINNPRTNETIKLLLDVKNPRTDEIINLIELAFKYCPDSGQKKEKEYKRKWLSKEHPYHPINEKDEMIYFANIKLVVFVMKYRLNNLFLSYSDYILYFNHCKNVFSILDFILTFLPSSHPEYIDNVQNGINLCEEILERKPKNKNYDFIEKDVKKKYNEYFQLIMEINPNFDIPPL